MEIKIKTTDTTNTQLYLQSAGTSSLINYRIKNPSNNFPKGKVSILNSNKNQSMSGNYVINANLI